MEKILLPMTRKLAMVLALSGAMHVYADDDTIKVGVLHSLSGTMAISETTLKDTVLMMIEEQNKAGGLLGKKLEPVVVDPASNWPLNHSSTPPLWNASEVTNFSIVAMNFFKTRMYGFELIPAVDSDLR